MARATIQDALDTAVRSVGRLPAPAAATPLRPLPLSLSLVAIAAATLACAVTVAVVAVLVIYAQTGREGLTDFMSDMRFDPPLKARIAAFTVSALYAGLALSTLAAARWRGGRAAWPALVAATSARWRVRGALVVALATLAYGIAVTAIQIAGRERHLMIAGPTDVLLLGTLATNLVVLAPLAEELFFRGWLFTALRARWSFVPSYLVVVASFAAIHVDADHRHMVRVLPLALAVGLLREITGSVRPTIALHATYNLAIVVMTLAAA